MISWTSITNITILKDGIGAAVITARMLGEWLIGEGDEQMFIREVERVYPHDDYESARLNEEITKNKFNAVRV